MANETDTQELPRRPLIVGFGGTTRTGSTSEKALRRTLELARLAGADIEVLAGGDIDLPMYLPGEAARGERASALISLLRRADGIVIASPGYHGSISGLIKNALDYVEDMRDDSLPYFEGRAIGMIACAAGWQAASSTLQAMRTIVHALRGWPTPLGVAINTIGTTFHADGMTADTAVANQLVILAQQVVDFARMRALHVAIAPTAAVATGSFLK